MATMKTRIILKNDTLENWNAEGSIVLKQGEIGLARVNVDIADGEGGHLTKPVYLMKVGHDNKKFSELEWLAAPASDVYGWAKKSSMDYADLPETLKTEIDDLQAAIGDGGSVADAIKAAVEALDVEDTAVEKQFVTAVAEADGKISVSRRALSADDIPALEISKITNLQEALNAKVEVSAFNTFKNENTQAIANAQAAAEAKAATAQAAAEAADDKAVAVDGKLDTEIARAKAAEEANAAAAKAADDKAAGAASAASAAQGTANEAVSAAGVADGKAVAAQNAVDALAGKVGTVPADTTVMDIIQNIQENAYDDTEIRDLISDLDTDKADKTQVATDIGAAKTELEGKITEVSTAVATEKSRAEGIEAGLESRLAAVEGDYLKAADKTELQGNIDTLSGDVTAIKNDYLKGADKTELSNAIALKADKTALEAEVARAQGIEGGLETRLKAVEDDYLTSSDKEAIQTQINTIMNNPDTEGVINSIEEFTEYITDHGTIAEGFRADIDANASAIESLEADVAATYQTKEDATAVHDALAAEIAAKAVQADWNQNDPSAADYVKNRTHYEEAVYALEASTTISTNEEVDSGSYKGITNGIYFSVNRGTLGRVVFDGVTYDNVILGGLDVGNASLLPLDPSYDDSKSDPIYQNDLPFFVYYEGQGYNSVYASTAGEHTIEIYSQESSTVKQLDEKFIPDTIARVSDINSVDGEVSDLKSRVETAEGDIDALEGAVATKAEQSALTQAVTDLQAEIDADVLVETNRAKAAEQANATAASDAAAAAAAAQAEIDALELVAIQEVTGANGIAVSGTGTARQVSISAEEVFVLDCGTATTVQ